MRGPTYLERGKRSILGGKIARKIKIRVGPRKGTH